MMEYCDQGDLMDYIIHMNEKQLRVPDLRLKGILNDITSALAYLHNKNLIHRDVKVSRLTTLCISVH